MTEHCPEHNYCQVALDLKQIQGEIRAELATGTQIMRSLKASIEANTNRVEKVLDKYESVLKEQEDRISKLEKKVWYASGATGAVSFLLGIFWRYLPFLNKP